MDYLPNRTPVQRKCNIFLFSANGWDLVATCLVLSPARRIRYDSWWDMLMKFSKLTGILIAGLAVCGSGLAQDSPDSVRRGTKQFRKSVLISGLEGPWELTWGPDKMLWVTERTGKRVVRVDPANGTKKVAVTIDEVSVPGGQDGLLGMALHPDLLKGKGNDFVYVAYSYVDKAKGADPAVTDETSPYRYLYMKVVRFTYDAASGTLAKPMVLITGLPASNDHMGGRLKVGPDGKLYLTIGDQGNNQLGNFCIAIEAQRLPTTKEVADKNYVAYVGKSLRINIDGSVPADNPKLDGVVSHVYTYGHRNPQGLNFGPDGTLYSSEHGPNTDDEVNVLRAGGNYGWPRVAGFKDNKAYEFARWKDASKPCSDLTYSFYGLDPSVPREPETSFTQPFVEPVATMFTVPTGFNFNDPACKSADLVCWPTVGTSGIEFYSGKNGGIPGWDKVLLVTTLKRGSIYVLPLKADGKTPAGKFWRYFQSENRYRDTAVSPDRKTIYVATDPSGVTEALAGSGTTQLEDKGAILAFTYTGEGTGAPVEPRAVSKAASATTSVPAVSAGGGETPEFTAAQAAAGKVAYASNCAVCHGNNLTNGSYGTPLGGEYFKSHWAGKSLKAFYDKAQKTMPPSSPGSLTGESYANIVAYILGMNGAKAGGSAMATGGDGLEKMTIK